LTELTVYATALAMNYVTRGRFVPIPKKLQKGNSKGGNRQQRTGDGKKTGGYEKESPADSHQDSKDVSL